MKHRIAKTFAGIDNRLNPMVVKESRQLVRSGILTGLLHLMLVGQMITFGWALLAVDPNEFSDEVGPAVFQIMLAILGLTCIIIVPAYAATRLAVERNTGGLELLALPSISFEKLILGKFYATMLLVGVIASTMLPFAFLVVMLRGVGVPAVFAGAVTTLLASAAAVFGSLVMACHIGPGASRIFAPLAIGCGILVIAGNQAVTNVLIATEGIVGVANCMCGGCCCVPLPVVLTAVLTPTYFLARASSMGRMFRKHRIPLKPPPPPPPFAAAAQNSSPPGGGKAG